MELSIGQIVAYRGNSERILFDEHFQVLELSANASGQCVRARSSDLGEYWFLPSVLSQDVYNGCICDTCYESRRK